MDLENKIKKFAFDLGFDLVGISKLKSSEFKNKVFDWMEKGRQGEMNWYLNNLDRRLDPRKNLYGKARTSISVGLFYRPSDLPKEVLDDSSRGIIARYALYDDYHRIMEKMLKKLAQKITNEINNKWDYHIYVDTGPVLEREVAAAAGLGFIGKNTTLINTSLGSYIFLGEIICDLSIKSSVMVSSPSQEQTLRQAQSDDCVTNKKYKKEKVQGTCASCVRCRQACPTGALPKPYVLDARKCISYLTIENKGPIPISLRPFLKNRIYGCDICQEVCPWNKKLKPDLISALKPRVDQAPFLLDLVSMTETDFQNKYKGTPILRAKYRGFMRNILVAIGNWGDKSAFSPVAKLVDSPEPLIRQHAAWALWQINKQEARVLLAGHLSKEEDKIVMEEMQLLLG